MYRSDSLWLVQEGTARPLNEVTNLPDRERYGYDWVVVEATDASEN